MKPRKNPAAVSLGRKGGKAGTGKAKARSSAVAKAAALKRWENHKSKPGPSNASDEPRPLGAVGSGRLLGGTEVKTPEKEK